MMGDFVVRLTFYDNAERLPVMLRVNRQSTGKQLYSKVTTDIDVDNQFQLFYKNHLIKQCDTPLSEIFHVIKVDVELVISMDGGAGGSLITTCAKCPRNTGDGNGRSCGPCNDLTDESIIDEIVDKRDDAWRVFCKVFSIAVDVQDRIEANTEDSSLRCIDVMHHIYHSNTALTWDNVKDTMRIHDCHLAQVISECDFSHLN